MVICSFGIPLQVKERRSSASLPRISTILSMPLLVRSMMAIEVISLRLNSAWDRRAWEALRGILPRRRPFRAMSTPRRYHRLRAVLARRQPDLTVLMEDVQVPRNLAAVLRSCDAVGVFEAHAVWPGGRLKISRPASGGNRKWLPVRKHRTLAEALAHLKDQGLRVLAAHPTPDAIPFREVDFTLPTALLVGNEDNGLTPEALAGADAVVTIPMEGMGTSLNVSVA